MLKKSQPLIVCYFGVNDKGGKNSMTLKRLRQQGCEILDVWVENKVTEIISDKDLSQMAMIKRLVAKLRIIPEIIKHTDRIRNSHVLFVGYPGHFDLPIAWVVAKLFGKPLIFDQSTFLVDTLADDVGVLDRQSLKAKLLWSLESWVYSLPDVILVDTKRLKDYIQTQFKVPGAKLKVLFLGADEEIYRFQGFKAPSQTLNVLYYGLYNPIHGVEHIVEAAHLLAKNKGIRFTMIGTGRLFPMAQELAKKYHLNNITFYPTMPEAEAQKLLKEADIFLGFMQNNSSADRFIPNKVAQGLALGKAVITCRSKAIEDVFTDQKNIYLCEPSNPQSLVTAITDLQSHPKQLQKLAKNGYELFNNTLSMKAVGTELHQLLRQSVA